MNDNKCKSCCRSHCAGIVAGIVFLAIAALHIARMALGWTVLINGHEMPTWCSMAGIVVFGVLGAWLLCCACCKKCQKSCKDSSCATK